MTGTVAECVGGPMDGQWIALQHGRELQVAMPPRPATVGAPNMTDAIPLREGWYAERLTAQGIVLLWQGEA